MKVKRLPVLDSIPERPNIGQRIATARNECGLTQKELAKEIGFRSGTAVSLIESGQRKVSVQMLWRIAHTTNVPVSFFFESNK